jgi:hypothetical protein
MDRTWTRPATPQAPHGHRSTQRRPVTLPARLSWKDRGGVARFASVVTRDISETGVFVECDSPVSIPLYRLVQFQLEREGRNSTQVPSMLRRGRVLSAVYRVTSTRRGVLQGLALRLMVDPGQLTCKSDQIRATA